MKQEDPGLTSMIMRAAIWRIAICYVALSTLAAITIDPLIDKLSKAEDGEDSGLATTLYLVEIGVWVILSAVLSRAWNLYDRRRGYFLSEFLKKQRKLVQKGVIAPLEFKRQLRSTTRKGWRIESNFLTVERPNKFSIHMKKTALGRSSDSTWYPDVFINGIKCGSHLSEAHDSRILNDAILSVNPEAALLKNSEMLIFELRHDDTVIDSRDVLNPYYVKPRWLKDSSFRWQCEGHSDEKIIIIRPDQLNDTPWDPKIKVAMNFDLLVNKRLVDIFVGVWEKDLREWHIPIPSISKHECIGKQAVIRITHLQGIKCDLPEPIVMSVDHSPVRSATYS